MLLSDFFDMLSYGELAQLNIGTDDTGRIARQDYLRMMVLVNRGLTALHTRLPLVYKQLLLQTATSLDTYRLTPQHAESTTPPVTDGFVRYILDSTNPFTGGLLQIDEVVGEIHGKYSLNMASDTNTVFIPAYDTLQFNRPLDERVAVAYRGNTQIKGVMPDTDLSQIELPIPDYCVEALAYFVVYCLVNRPDATQAQLAGAYLQKYEMALQQIKDEGFVATNSYTNEDLFRRAGWV